MISCAKKNFERKSLTGMGEFYEILPNIYEIVRKIIKFINPNICVLNTKVTSIFQYNHCAIVSTANQHQFLVSLIVLAIPFTSIEKIHFVPHFEFTTTNRRSSNMSTTFIATYDHEISNFFNKVLISMKPDTMVIYDDGPKTLFGTLYHNQQYSNDSLKNQILHQIRLETMPIEWYQKTWKQSSFIFQHSPLINPWHRIIWASTNITNLQFRGYLNGSIQSGMNAALLVLSHFRPQLIDWTDYNDVTEANVISPKNSFIENLSTLFSFANILQCSIGFLYIIICRAIYFKTR